MTDFETNPVPVFESLSVWLTRIMAVTAAAVLLFWLTVSYTVFGYLWLPPEPPAALASSQAIDAEIAFARELDPDDAEPLTLSPIDPPDARDRFEGRAGQSTETLWTAWRQLADLPRTDTPHAVDHHDIQSLLDALHARGFPAHGPHGYGTAFLRGHAIRYTTCDGPRWYVAAHAGLGSDRHPFHEAILRVEDDGTVAVVSHQAFALHVAGIEGKTPVWVVVSGFFFAMMIGTWAYVESQRRNTPPTVAVAVAEPRR